MLVKDTKDNNDTIKKQADELRAQEENNYGNRKLWKKHQDNEYTKVNHYKEGMCYMCWSKADYAYATIIMVCRECSDKKGDELVLANVAPKIEDMCDVCGQWKMDLMQKNVRLCPKDVARVAQKHREYRRGGGFFNQNPFWKKMQRKFGKDYKILFSQPETVRI